MTPAQAANFVERFARRYVAERENQEWRDHAAVDSIKAQGWAILQAAAALRATTEDESEGATGQ